MYENKAFSELKAVDKEQPLDTVSQIVWDQNSSNDLKFLVASWDGFVRFYGIRNDQYSGPKVERLWEMFLQHPVLCADFNEEGIVFAGLASGEIVAVQCLNSQSTTLGTHSAPICGLYWIKQMRILMSLGFDQVIKFWKIDCNPVFQAQFTLPFKTATCSFSFPFLLLGSIQATIAFINLSKLPNLIIPKAEQYKTVSIERFSKFNCSRVQAKGNVAVLGTIDGRAVILNFKEANNGDFEVTNNYVIRAQKRVVVGTTLYTQVDAIDIGISNSDFFVAIGGSEDLGIYNHYKKLKVKNLTPSSQSGASTAVSFSPKYDYVAFAVGSDWLKGIYELETVKRAKIGVAKLSNTDMLSFTTR